MARFSDSDATDTAYRECVQALLANTVFLGLHFSNRSHGGPQSQYRPRRVIDTIVFEIDGSYPPEKYVYPNLRERFFTRRSPKDTTVALVKPRECSQLQRAALGPEEVFLLDHPETQPQMRRQRIYDVYAEFGTSQRADEVREILLYRPFERWQGLFVLSAERDPNPACVKILVTSLNRDKLQELAKEFGILRITRNHGPLYERPKQLAPA
ncbi:MAG: hypothetical protein M1275_03990 [Patescibacteria group bacterium]|nr:hypothetical protein [Patescibacteria group bacterium]